MTIALMKTLVFQIITVQQKASEVLRVVCV
jgi:hypothetical protein